MFYVMRHFDRYENPSFFTTLTPDGMRRAGALFVPGVERIVCSPFVRCIQSVETFARENNVPINIACALGEYIDSDAHGIPLETAEAMRTRVLKFLKSDAASRGVRRTLYVTHESVAKVMVPGATSISVGELLSVKT